VLDGIFELNNLNNIEEFSSYLPENGLSLTKISQLMVFKEIIYIYIYIYDCNLTL
jgi:hypothetical protein